MSGSSPILPQNEPNRLTAGDTWQWTRRLIDYPPDTFTLWYFLRAVNVTGSTGKLDVSAGADPNAPDQFLVTVPSATTAPLPSGEWVWQAAVKDANGNRTTLDGGTLWVDQNLEALTGGVDNRTHNQKMLDAIEALLEKRATKSEESYQIAGRSLKHLTPQELVQWHGVYKNRVRREQAEAKQLKRSSTDLKVRFGPINIIPVPEPFSSEGQ